MDFEKVQAEWVLGRFPWEKLPDVAAEAMVAGFEGPFILDLVGYAAPSLHLLKAEVIEGAFRELGLPPIDEAAATLRLARRVASLILRRQVSPLVGALDIYLLARAFDWLGPGEPLWKFREVLLVLEDRPELVSECEQRAIELCWALLEEDPCA